MPPKVHQTRGSKPSNDSEETTTTTFIKREPQSPQQNQQLQPSATPQKQNQITDVDYNPFFSPTADPTINEDNFLNSPDVANKRKRVNSKSGVVGDRFIANRIYNDPVSAYTLHNEVNRPSSTHKRKAPEPDSHRETQTQSYNTALSSTVNLPGIQNQFDLDSSTAPIVTDSNNGTPGRIHQRNHYPVNGQAGRLSTPLGAGVPSGRFGSASATTSHSHSVQKNHVAMTERRESHTGMLAFASPNSQSAHTINFDANARITSLVEARQIASLGIIDDPNDRKFSVSGLPALTQRLMNMPRKVPRDIPKIPYKVLDAPELQDDFYLNLLDWSAENQLAVGLGTSVYLWNAMTSKVTKLHDFSPYDNVTAVSWNNTGSQIAVGTNRGSLLIWDAKSCRRISEVSQAHSARIGAIAWHNNIVSTGSRDRTIKHWDSQNLANDAPIRVLASHRQEVCGLRYCKESGVLASGGNDNKLMIWQGTHDRPVHTLSGHEAAVKAIAWSPHSPGLLASGGGTADRHICFWNTLTGTQLSRHETGSQVCNIVWSKTSNELVSTHGYSQNQIIVWKYPAMTQTAVLTGHTYRVLYLAMSPDGTSIVTGAGDETLRFWNVFGKPKKKDLEGVSLLEPKLNLR